MNYYFGPLKKEYCVYFYYLSIFSFFTYITILFGIILFVVKNYKKPAKLDMAFFVNSVMLLINTLLAYFVNRLLHTMCVNSIR
jgi:hypothetical protein